MRARVLLAGIIAATLLSMSTNASASCAEDPRLAKMSELDRMISTSTAPGVVSFIGTAEASEPAPRGYRAGPDAPGQIYTMTPFTVRAPIQDVDVTLETAVTRGGTDPATGVGQSVSTETTFNAGTSYLVIGQRLNDGNVMIGSCSPTREIPPEQEAAFVAAVSDADAGRGPVAYIAFGAIILAALGAVGGAIWYARRSS